MSSNVCLELLTAFCHTVSLNFLMSRRGQECFWLGHQHGSNTLRYHVDLNLNLALYTEVRLGPAEDDWPEVGRRTWTGAFLLSCYSGADASRWNGKMLLILFSLFGLLESRRSVILPLLHVDSQLILAYSSCLTWLVKATYARTLLPIGPDKGW